MIEVIYKDEKKESDSEEEGMELPKNIRQIGLISEDYRIYMEDYVYTFLGKTAVKGSREDKGSLIIFTGETRWNGGVTYIFIKGAVAVKDSEISLEHLEIEENVWQQINAEIDTYFQGQDITGWFYGQRSLSVIPGENFRKIHQKHFGADKVLMLMEFAEKEEAFFRYENNFLIRQNGYYLYYEKNPQMQTYMIEKNPEFAEEKTDEITDEAVHTFRKLIQKKKRENNSEEEHPSVFSYAATACLALALVMAGGRFYQNYRQIQNVEKTVQKDVEKETKQVSSDNINTENTEDTVTPVPDEAEISPVLTPKATQKPQNEEIYKEESDIRKAQRREREEQKQDAETENSEESSAAASENTYVIRPGDTLYQISIANYGTMDKVAEICRKNGIAEDEVIYPGQIIVLP